MNCSPIIKASRPSALTCIGSLYDVERETATFSADERHRVRQIKSNPVIKTLHKRMLACVPEGSAIARALDYSLKRWVALTRYLDDGAVPIGNNWVENQIRP
ncbi:hypothetical protein GCM10027565_28150 [Bordetella tumulicola]